MYDEWLTPLQAAEVLGCSEETVRAMLRDELLSGKAAKGEWQVKAVQVERIQSMNPPTPLPEPPVPSSPPKVEPGIVEVSIALAGIATAIAAFLPGIGGIPKILKLIVATISSAVALLSAYGSLWLLACYCLPCYCVTGESLVETQDSLLDILGMRDIWALLRNFAKIGPYKFIVGGLLFLLALSVVIGILAYAI